MELDGKLVEDDDPKILDLEGLEGKETKSTDASGRSELGYCLRCLELEEKCQKAEENWGVLELEIEKKKHDFELLDRLPQCFLDKQEKENGVPLFEAGNKEIEKKRPQDVGDSTEEGDKVFELMMEKNALNAEIGVWEAKCKDLELRVAELEKGFVLKKWGKFIDWNGEGGD